jgi:hypothetical protein
MKRALINAILSVALAVGVAAPTALAKHSRMHKAAVERCKREYKSAVRDAKTYRGYQRKIRIEDAKRALRDCKATSPR